MIGRILDVDRTLFRDVNAVWVSPLLDHALPALSLVGTLGAIWLFLLGGIAVFGKRSGRRIALVGLVALAIGFASSELLKELTMRPRPFLALPDVRLLVPEPRSYAFPSGHTTSAFAAATGALLAARKLLGKTPVWGWAMLALAAAIAYSRIYVGVHWPTDVLGGAVLGAASGWLGARIALRRRGRRTVREESRAISEDAREVESVLERG